MRVLQLIDSLNAGGAERMSVNIANALSTRIDTSFLCATRKEGVLKESINKNVIYFFLNKNKAIDIKAIRSLNSFIKQYEIEIIHAHSTSFFLATLIKFLNNRLIIVWHDHYGESEHLNKRKYKALRFCSNYFSHIFSVNSCLETWAKTHLKTKKSSYLPNFPIQDSSKPMTKLLGENGKRILHLANLRPQKDHITLLNAFKIVNDNFFDWTLHLVGKEFNDDYALSIKTFIKQNNLENHVFVYGSCTDISNILNQSDIGVLSSKSEGLPVSLLEYGLIMLPVVATNVGDCNKVISNTNEGILVEPDNDIVLSKAISKLIEDKDLRNVIAENLHQKVVSSFSESKSIDSLMKIYKQYQ